MTNGFPNYNPSPPVDYEYLDYCKKREAAEFQIEHNKSEKLLALGNHPDQDKQCSYNALGILQKKIKSLQAENMELRKKIGWIERLLDEHS